MSAEVAQLPQRGGSYGCTGVQAEEPSVSEICTLPTEPDEKLISECGSSSVGRVSAFQADCREFESRLPLIKKSPFRALFYCEEIGGRIPEALY